MERGILRSKRKKNAYNIRCFPVLASEIIGKEGGEEIGGKKYRYTYVVDAGGARRKHGRIGHYSMQNVREQSLICQQSNTDWTVSCSFVNDFVRVHIRFQDVRKRGREMNSSSV
jgi:hypothetical protein